jgi:hypothetical protein
VVFLCFYFISIGIRNYIPTVRSFFVFSLFLLGLGTSNKLKTKKYHTVGLVPNPNRTKLRTKKYHTVGLVPYPNRNKLKTKKYHTVGI